MAATIKKEKSIENDEVIKLKLETATIVENLVKNFDAKISTPRDFKILTVSILQREAMIRHLQYITANQSIPSKSEYLNTEQQTFPEDLHVNQAQQTHPEDFLVIQTPVYNAIDTTPNQKNISSQTVKNIDTVSTQTDQDQVVLSNLNKISNLERSLSQMDHNQDLLLSELNLQRKDNFVLQEEISMIKKKMAEVIFANNLYHVSLVEQNCSLPADAEELLSSLSKGGKAEDLYPSSIIQLSKKQDAIYPFQKV